MIRTITATQAKNKFGELIKRVYTSGERVIVEKDGLPVVIISPVSEKDLHSQTAQQNSQQAGKTDRLRGVERLVPDEKA
jgi:prevent-host-death family protein